MIYLIASYLDFKDNCNGVNDLKENERNYHADREVEQKVYKVPYTTIACSSEYF